MDGDVWCDSRQGAIIRREARVLARQGPSLCIQGGPQRGSGRRPPASAPPLANSHAAAHAGRHLGPTDPLRRRPSPGRAVGVVASCSRARRHQGSLGDEPPAPPSAPAAARQPATRSRGASDEPGAGDAGWCAGGPPLRAGLRRSACVHSTASRYAHQPHVTLDAPWPPALSRSTWRHIGLQPRMLGAAASDT